MTAHIDDLNITAKRYIMNCVQELRDKMNILNRELTAEQKRSENLEVEANKV